MREKRECNAFFRPPRSGRYIPAAAPLFSFKPPLRAFAALREFDYPLVERRARSRRRRREGSVITHARAPRRPRPRLSDILTVRRPASSALRCVHTPSRARRPPFGSYSSEFPRRSTEHLSNGAKNSRRVASRLTAPPAKPGQSIESRSASVCARPGVSVLVRRWRWAGKAEGSARSRRWQGRVDRHRVYSIEPSPGRRRECARVPKGRESRARIDRVA